MVLALAAILDPTKKVNFVSFTYSKIDPDSCEEKVSEVKMNLYKLYAEYVNCGSHSNMALSQSQGLSQSSSSFGSGEKGESIMANYLYEVS